MSYARPGFRILFLHAAAAALIAGGQAAAQPADFGAGVAADEPVADGAERSPFLGVWELDLTRMPADYGPPPKRVTFTFDDLGSGKWRTKIEIVAPDGGVRRIDVAHRRDGRMARGEGDRADGDSVAVNSPAPNVLVMSLAKDKGLESVRVYAVSADGREMTESAADVDREGSPFVRNFHFKRIR